jgi:hypothetical protein
MWQFGACRDASDLRQATRSADVRLGDVGDATLGQILEIGPRRSPDAMGIVVCSGRVGRRSIFRSEERRTSTWPA